MTSPNSTTRPRTLVDGKKDGSTFILTLDGGERVETTNREIAVAAAKAKTEGLSFTADIEYRNGSTPRLTEIVLLPKTTVEDPPAAKPAAPAPVKTALVERPDVQEGLIATAHELRDVLTKFRDHYNVVSPAIQISQLAPGYGANLSVVPIDTTVDREGAGSDTYLNKKIMKDDERALSKIGLVRISQAAGINWSPDHCRRLDDGRTRNLWRWGYYGVYRTYDGSMAPVIGSAELDLRDGSDEIKGWTDGQVKAQRSKGNEICETKAMLRAIRSIGIRQKYSVVDLKKPFLLVRFTFTPDMSDPEIKKLVTEQALKGASMLFGPPPAALAAPDFTAAADDVDEPTPATEEPDPFAVSQKSDTPAGTTMVVELKPRTGVNPRTKRPWRLVVATFASGEIASTFDADVQAKLDQALAEKWPVRVTTTPSENPAYDDTIASLTVLDPRQPTLPGTEAL